MTITLADIRDSYDWKEVLGYAGKDGTSYGQQPGPGAVGENPPHTEPFGMDDVEEVLAADEGENDGPSWMVALRLKDGRFAYIEAGCDYTGWDCQAGGSACVASSLEQLVLFGLTDEARKRLDLKIGGGVMDKDKDAEWKYCRRVFGALHFPFSTNEIVEAFVRERALARAEVEARYAELVGEAVKAFDAHPSDDPSLDALHAALVKLGR